MKRLRLLWPVVIALFALVIYANAAGNGFVYDDTPEVVMNPWIRSAGNIGIIFTSSAWGYLGDVTNYYRPLIQVFYMGVYAIFGLNPLGFHLFNILVHGGVSILVFLVALRLLQKNAPSSNTPVLYFPAIAGLLFASHPIHTEAVSWICGIGDLSFTFFCLASFYAYMRLPATRIPSFDPVYLMSLVLFSLATLCKETALVFPLVLIVYDQAIREDAAAPLRRLKGYLPFFGVAAVYFLLRFHAIGSFAPVKRHAELSTFQYIISAFPLLMDYFAKLILPTDLHIFYTFHPVTSVASASALFGFIFMAVLIAVLFATYRRNKRAFFFLTLLLIPLLPVLYLPGLGENPFAERYLYLPSAGFVLLLSLIGQSAANAKPGRVLVLSVAVCLMIAMYSAGVVRRNTVWKNDHTLWEDTVEKSPDAAIAHYNFGVILYKEGDLHGAIRQYQTALRLEPSPKAYNDLAVAYNDMGLPDNAIPLLQAALRLNPYFADARNNLGVAYMGKGQYENAIEQFKIAAGLAPSFTGTYSNLGLCYERLGMKEDAIQNYKKALQLDAHNVTARNNLNALLSEEKKQ
jgi:tetratricopeptide (TPR) repeat protein